MFVNILTLFYQLFFIRFLNFLVFLNFFNKLKIYSSKNKRYFSSKSAEEVVGHFISIPGLTSLDSTSNLETNIGFNFSVNSPIPEKIFRSHQIQRNLYDKKNSSSSFSSTSIRYQPIQGSLQNFTQNEGSEMKKVCTARV